MKYLSYQDEGTVITSGGPLWEVWIPGQCPPGKNQVQLRRDPKTGRLRPRPRRRKNAAGEYTPTSWERWYWKLDEHMYWRRLEKKIPPISSPTRLVVHYWWGDKRNRDEPGRMDALSALLEATEWVTDDKFLRQLWFYRGLCRKTPGLYVAAREDAAVQDWAISNGGRVGASPGEALELDPARVTVRRRKSAE